MLFEGDGGEIDRKVDDRYWRIDDRRVDLDLSNVRIATVLVIGEDRDLNEKRTVLSFVLLQIDDHPAGRLVQLQLLDLLQILKVIADSNRDPVRCVRFVQLVVCEREQRHFLISSRRFRECMRLCEPGEHCSVNRAH